MPQFNPNELVSELFRGTWTYLHGQGALSDPKMKWPGIYVIGWSEDSLDGRKIRLDEIVYIGMSNSAGGVRQRLKQFMSGLKKGEGHSAGNRVFSEHNKEWPFDPLKSKKQFYFNAVTLKCTSQKAEAGAEDFVTMGHVACAEYYAFARFHSEMGGRPFLNVG